MRILILCFLFVSVGFQTPNVDKDVPAKNKEFIKFLEKHGKEIAPTYNEVNCVQFMNKSLKRFLISVPRETCQRMYISHNIETINKLIASNDTTIISGVCAALVDANLARWIKPEDAKQGDIIQYWSTSGFTNGHCGIIYGEDSNGFILYGSHPDSKGFGKMNMLNKSIEMKVFIVRLK
jgi:hypothetical protein